MSESKEPMLFINWQEVRKRWSRFGFALVAGLFYLAILALIFEAVHIVLYAANLPAAGGLLKLPVAHQQTRFSKGESPCSRKPLRKMRCLSDLSRSTRRAN